MDAWLLFAGTVCSGLISLVVSWMQNNKTMALVIYRLEQLEKKQDKYNNLQERTLKLEQKIEDMEK